MPDVGRPITAIRSHGASPDERGGEPTGHARGVDASV
jgi:hypothetical protein